MSAVKKVAVVLSKTARKASEAGRQRKHEELPVSEAVPMVGIHAYSTFTARTRCGWPGDLDTRWRMGTKKEVTCVRCLGEEA